MSNEHRDSVTRDLRDLPMDDESSTTARFLRRYWGQVQGLVRPRLQGDGGAAASGGQNGVAHAAPRSIVEPLERGKYPGIAGRDGLWRMLAKYAAQRAGRIVKKWNGHAAAGPLSKTKTWTASSRC